MNPWKNNYLFLKYLKSPYGPLTKVSSPTVNCFMQLLAIPFWYNFINSLMDLLFHDIGVYGLETEVNLIIIC